MPRTTPTVMPETRAALVLVCAALMSFAGGVAAGAEPPRAVVELFTSQGCSSCPPADQLMSEIASDPSVLVLSLPVDYWDYIGWKDTLAERSFTIRQKAYGESRGDRQVYTPQAVVDGVGHAVGSDRAAVFERARDGTGRGALSLPVKVEATSTTILVSVPSSQRPLTHPTHVMLLPVLKRTEVAIGRGENKGRSVVYTNVVRDLISLGVWDGSARTFEAPAKLARHNGADSFVVVVQEGPPDRPGLILGAAKAPGL